MFCDSVRNIKVKFHCLGMRRLGIVVTNFKLSRVTLVQFMHIALITTARLDGMSRSDTST